MAASADQNPSRTAGDDRNLVTVDENYLAPSLEDRVMIFWDKHGRTVIALLVIIVLAIVGRWAFQLFAEARERAVAAEYAAAKDAAALQAFAAAQPTAPLAGAAHLRLADEAYSAGDFQAAQAAYDAAAKVLAGKPLGERARIGSAISKLQAGDTAAAKTALEALANDSSYARTFRGEAAFHLAVLARDAGQPAEAVKWTELVLSADPTGLWAQRALQLRSTLPAASTTSEPAPDAAAAAPVSSELNVTPATVPTEPVSEEKDAPAAVSFPAAK